ncbi:hypothetical protein [Streptomyces melanogenes]|uniref:hypothetical protein n=1 Tax=Streptomyces melanogenes TaxID=67326 RepID=UPI00167CA4C3|nr:hypothetical protein [Streptomyces melanogenes]GGP80795.1 hypothetical protein GCM10010278_69150 [Streptomyces melanogenes]
MERPALPLQRPAPARLNHCPAHPLALEARELGLAVDMGRVNSRRWLRLAQAIGCTSADGTYLAFGPDTNLPRLLAWMNELHTTPTLFGDDA